MLSQGQVGPTVSADGIQAALRSGKTGEQIVTELQGRFYENAYRGAAFRTGSTAITALSANSITSATSATGTPILGIYNPLGSGKNAVILQATLQVMANTLTTPVGAGAFVWLVSTGNSAVSTGATPFNMGTLAASGSVCKGFVGGVALTGLTNVMAVAFAADFQTPTGLTHGTMTAVQPLFSVGGVSNIDGSIIVPPGGVLGLYNTVSTTTMSAVGSLLWNEVAV
jgi:hypothetical protein